MKVRKAYSIVINGNTRVASLVRKKSRWAFWMQCHATCGVSIWDCNFEEAVHNLKYLKYEKGYYTHKSYR